MICKYFLPLYASYFYSVNCGFGCTEVLNFDIIQFIFIFVGSGKYFSQTYRKFQKYILEHIETFNREQNLENICHSL